jgi:DNA (cytosine-5)-methyltransferase 1
MTDLTRQQISGQIYGLDLFSGIGGITKALEPWVRPIAYCENDRHATAVLLSNMARGNLPAAPIWDDVCTLKGAMLPCSIDIIYGGFPCQDISLAGRRAGLAGKRSGLYWQIFRLVEELNPAFVFLENVPSIKTLGGVAIVASLTRAGYNSRWLTLSAAEVGALHIRKRWWLLAHADSERRGQEQVVRKGSEDSPKSRNDGSKEPMADTNAIWSPDWWEAEPDVGRVVDGLPHRAHRIRGLGNAVVPAQAREAFKQLMGLQ